MAEQFPVKEVGRQEKFAVHVVVRVIGWYPVHGNRRSSYRWGLCGCGDVLDQVAVLVSAITQSGE
jgi:hypothetical protein